MKTNLSDEARKWIQKAESDLEHAQSSKKLKDYYWVQTASQQSAEKALKSLCISKGIGLMRTHELPLLAKKMDAPKKILEKSGLLSSFYTASSILTPKSFLIIN